MVRSNAEACRSSVRGPPCPAQRCGATGGQASRTIRSRVGGELRSVHSEVPATPGLDSLAASSSVRTKRPDYCPAAKGTKQLANVAVTVRSGHTLTALFALIAHL